MSLGRIQSIFENLDKCNAWSIQLLGVQTSKIRDTTYTGTSIRLTPDGKLNEFVKEIMNRYSDYEKGALKAFSGVQDYDGTTHADIIYKLDLYKLKVTEEYEAFTDAVNDPNEEGDPLKQKTQAYIIQGIVENLGEETHVRLISMQNPIRTLKHKFFYNEKTFSEITDKVLSLRPVVDVVILDDVVYFLSMAGERLFNMERAYKTICEDKVSMLESSGILYSADAFAKVAKTGHHPRMFVSFNEQRYEKLKDFHQRKHYAKMFDIPLKDGKFDTSQKEAAGKLVKLLCNKGMVDPFEELPVEVSSARKWQ